jgi:integrase
MGYTRVRTTRTGQDRHTAYYHDIRGRECSAGTFGHKRQADRAWRRAEGRIAEGRFLDVRSGRQTFYRYVEGVWLPHHPMEPTTRQGYSYIIGKHLLPAFGRMRMAEVLPSDIRAFLGKLHAAGVQAATAHRCKTVLGAIFTTALADGVVFLHPCRGVKGPAIGKTPVRILTPTELIRLRVALPDEQWRLWLDTAVETGARWGELAELRVNDLNPAVRTITIARTLLELQPPFHSDHGQFLVKPYTKNRDFRVLRLSRALTTRLTAHIISHQLDPGDLLFGRPLRHTAAYETNGTDAGIVAGGPASNAGAELPHGRIGTYANHDCRCSQCRGAYARYRATRRAAGKDRPPVPYAEPDPHLSRHWFRKQIWNPATTTAGLTHRLRIHDLRHTNASWMIAGSADLQTVRERLGHASLRATERYLHTLPDTDDTALHALATVRNHRQLHRPERRGVRHGHLTVAHTRKPLR